MGRAPCCDKNNVKRGPWSPEEDAKLKGFIDKYGTGGNWIALPRKAGLKRCGKSCRLRWLNYLRPNIKHGEFTDDEDRIICSLYANIGSRWSIIAGQLPGRTDNDIKNYWNTKLKKKLLAMLLSFQKKPSFFPSLPLQSPPLYNNSSPFYSYTNPNFMNMNNNINSLLDTTTSLAQGHFNMTNLSLPQQDSNSLISLLTNNNIANNENNSFYLGSKGNNDQIMYPTSDVKEAMLMFGNHEVSTTGSSSENLSCLSQISYENYYKDHHQIKQEDKFFLQGFGDQSQSFIVNNMSYIDEKPNNLKSYESLLLHSELEEVKQLIIANENDDEYKTTHDHDQNEICYHY